MTTNNPFLSLFLATCRPEQIKGFLENLQETCHDPKQFEVMIKIDEGDDETKKAIDQCMNALSLNIRYLQLPKLDGYYSLNEGYNTLFKIINPNAYFAWNLTDEVRFETKNWDNIIKKYIGYFDDDIFRIKISEFKFKNYYDLRECLTSPENYAITTKRWLELTGGWGEFWGPDGWHQCIDYFLGMTRNKYLPYGIYRSLPIDDIVLSGLDAGVGVTEGA